ncbi:hypothetical protein, partial [Thiolapillus sp.]
RIQDYTQSNGKWPSLIIELLYQFSQGQIALNRSQGDLRFKSGEWAIGLSWPRPGTQKCRN